MKPITHDRIVLSIILIVEYIAFWAIVVWVAK